MYQRFENNPPRHNEQVPSPDNIRRNNSSHTPNNNHQQNPIENNLPPMKQQPKHQHAHPSGNFFENFFKEMPFDDVLLIALILILMEDKKSDWLLILALGYLYISGKEGFDGMFKNVTSILTKVGGAL